MAEFQSIFTGQEVDNTINKLRSWIAVDGTYPTVTISGVTYAVIWKSIPVSGKACYGIGLHPTTGRPYEIYYNGSSYTATALDADTKNTAGATNDTGKLYLVGTKTQDTNPQTYSNSKVYTQDGKLYSNSTEVLTAHQSIKSLNTNNNSVLTVNSSEAIAGSGTISLNGISKTAQEEYLQWGGPSKSGAVSPIGMTLSNEHSANRMAFINGDLITAEYSSDGGTTWTEYSASTIAKSQFFTQSFSFAVGRPNESTEVIADKSKTRITITAQNGNNPSGRVYTDPRKMLILVSTATALELLVEYRSGTNYKNNGAWTTFGTYSLSGWSGWNDIPLVLNTLGGGADQLGNNWQLRLTFTVKTKSTSYPKAASVLAARIYGQNTWTTPSTMAGTGHMYTFDMSKNVTFPAGVSATSFIENGTPLANKYIAKSLTSTKGDIIYASAANTPARLGIGSNGQFLSVSNNVPTWVNNPNTNTWRKVQLNGTDKLGTGINTNPLNIKAGSNMTITESNGTFTFAATDTNTDTKVTAVGNHYTPANGTDLTVSSSGTASRGSTKVLTNVAIDAAGHITGGTWYTLPSSDNIDTHYTNYLQIKGNGTEAVKFTQNADKTLNLKPGNNVAISAASGEITISATDTTYSLASNTTASGGIKYITEVSFTNGVLTLESKYLHLN